jgi:hypothetical protein
MGLVHDIGVLVTLIVELDARARSRTFVLQRKATPLKQCHHLIKGEVCGQCSEPFYQFLFFIHAAKVTKNNYIAKLFGGNLNDSYSYFSTTLFGNSEKNVYLCRE